MKKLILFIFLSLLILVALFIIIKPTTEITPEPKSPTKAVASPTLVTTNQKAFTLAIRNSELVAENKTIEVTEGDTVTLTITADTEEELHIHGYDLTVPLEQNMPKQYTFEASMTGSFPIELHHAEKEIALLQVLPK